MYVWEHELGRVSGRTDRGKESKLMTSRSPAGGWEGGRPAERKRERVRHVCGRSTKNWGAAAYGSTYRNSRQTGIRWTVDQNLRIANRLQLRRQTNNACVSLGPLQDPYPNRYRCWTPFARRALRVCSTWRRQQQRWPNGRRYCSDATARSVTDQSADTARHGRLQRTVLPP